MTTSGISRYGCDAVLRSVGRRALGERLELVEQDADVAGALVGLDVGRELDATDRRTEMATATGRSWRGEVLMRRKLRTRHEVRSSGVHQTGLGGYSREPLLSDCRVAPNWFVGDTLGVRRHDRDVVPPASTSGSSGPSPNEQPGPDVESRAVAPASLESREVSAPRRYRQQSTRRVDFLSRHTSRFHRTSRACVRERSDRAYVRFGRVAGLAARSR